MSCLPTLFQSELVYFWSHLHLLTNLSNVQKYTKGEGFSFLCFLTYPGFQRQPVSVDSISHTSSSNYILIIRRIWRYQRGNYNPYIEEEQTTQWPKEQVQKDKQRCHHFESFTVVTMIWLTAMEYLRHKWPRICSTCREHFRPFLVHDLSPGL
jgi:hypothetical protein